MQKYDNFVFGLFTGIAGVFAGMFVYYLLQYSGMGLTNFIAFARQPIVLAPLISLGALADLALFFLYLNKHMASASRGVIFSLFICVLLVVVLKSHGG